MCIQREDYRTVLTAEFPGEMLTSEDSCRRRLDRTKEAKWFFTSCDATAPYSYEGNLWIQKQFPTYSCSRKFRKPTLF